MDPKRAAAEKAVNLVRNGMTVGLGSGSTASWAIRKLGELVKEGLEIRTVASSVKSEKLARELGIAVYDPSEIATIDIAVDGADEVDKKGNLIKGGGGSLLREKIVAYASKQFHVMVDESKIKEVLGSFPLPVEIVRFASDVTLRHLQALGCKPVIRQAGSDSFITDNGNYIADCNFDEIGDPAALDVRAKMIPGVVETGLFSSKVVTSIFVGHKSGEVTEIRINN